MDIKRSKIFNDCKAFLLKQMYAKKITPERAKEIVLRIKPSLTVAKTPKQKQEFIDMLDMEFPELKPIQTQYKQAEHEHFDDIIGEVAEKLLDKGDFDNISVLNDWYENEKPDDEKIRLYIEYNFPSIAREVFNDSSIAVPEATLPTKTE
jgi:hypothetical protein